nr:MAG TPA: hypothetical protein [Caudoviricetes sp.]
MPPPHRTTRTGTLYPGKERTPPARTHPVGAITPNQRYTGSR